MPGPLPCPGLPEQVEPGLVLGQRQQARETRAEGAGGWRDMPCPGPFSAAPDMGRAGCAWGCTGGPETGGLEPDEVPGARGTDTCFLISPMGWDERRLSIGQVEVSVWGWGSPSPGRGAGVSPGHFLGSVSSPDLGFSESTGAAKKGGIRKWQVQGAPPTCACPYSFPPKHLATCVPDKPWAS